MTFYCVFICTELLAITTLIMELAVTISAKCIKNNNDINVTKMRDCGIGCH
jgi:hypothetical protein